MIKYLKHNQIDKSRWDDCIERSVNGIVYGYSWYLDIVHEGWDALIEEDYQSVFPLTGQKKHGIEYLFQPFYTQQLGVFSVNHLTSDLIKEFLLAIPANYRFAEINLNTYNDISGLGLEVIEKQNFELDLVQPYDLLFKKYSTNLKRNIKKAVKNKLLIVNNVKPEDVIQLFKVNKGKDIQTLNETSYRILNRLIFTAIHRGQAFASGVYNAENELLAGGFFMRSHQKIVFLFSATAFDARNSGALHLLIDQVVKDFSGQNVTLDFEGSNDPNLARFYKSFGSNRCVYYQYNLNRLPWLINLVLKIKKKIIP
ncbi:MAG: hypothetical protein JEZ03_00755 [Bacteroidales bacterium]|nr:hypothetical protein [Bacteroidales bacterium]